MSVVLGTAACKPHAPKLSDPRSRTEKQWDTAHELEGDDKTQEALDGYLALCTASTPYVRACFDHARLFLKTGPVSKARKTALFLIERYPNEAFAPSLVKQLSRSFADSSEIESGRVVLASLSQALLDTEIGDSILYEEADLARIANDTDGEKAALSRLVEHHGRWKSQLWDDAVWRLAAIHREAGDTDREIEWLNTLKAAHESSRLIGSYTSPFHDDALLRLGEIYLATRRFDEARREFDTLAATTASRMCDDGLLGSARVDLATGKKKEACTKLAAVEAKDGSAKRRALKLIISSGCGQ